MEGLKIAVIGGGSSYTPELIEGFIKRANELPIKEIYLVDIEAGKEKLDIVGNLTKRMVEKSDLELEVKLTLDRREAIKDANFIITQFRVGLLEARSRDERIPLQYDVIGQETTGPGGFAKGMRTIPVIMDICKEIEELAPNAWLINFTNPAGMITETVLKHTDVKVIGLCNVPINMTNTISDILQADLSRVRVNFAGLNHLVWAREIYLDGEDCTDLVINRLCDGAYLNMNNIPDLDINKDLLESLGMVPCPYHNYYYQAAEILAEEKKAVASGKGTRANQVMEIENELFETYADPDLDVKPPQLEQRGGAYYSDAAVSLISAIYNDKREMHVVNVRNNGTIKNLPDDVAVEVNCMVDASGAHPMTVGELPPRAYGLMQVVKAYEELSVEAGVNGDYEKALQALIIHPLVPSAKVAKKLLDDIIEKNKDYLPQFK
ncbi:6-phospho-beta-glucosidase [Halanaerocella petrolearia]